METSSTYKTHPLVLAAAASVMVVSLMGAAAIGGLLPNAHSEKADAAVSAPTSVRNAASSGRIKNGTPKLPAYANMCDSCGTVASIHAVLVKGNATGLGAVAGGVTGALVGNQIGRGSGNTAMTILGAAGGAFAGNEIEKNAKEHTSYRVTVHMDDGSYRTLPQLSAPEVRVGERVRVVDGRVVTRS